MTDSEAKALCDRIRQTAYDLHAYLGTGFLEKIYETGLAHRLEKAGHSVQTQIPVAVHDEDGFLLGEYIADMIADGILVELKAVTTLRPEHLAQTINYLHALRMDHGLLINFGSPKFQCRHLYRRK
jgi:GxxExxY protein